MSTSYDHEYLERKTMERLMTEDERIKAAHIAAIAEKAERKAKELEKAKQISKQPIQESTPVKIINQPNNEDIDVSKLKIRFRTKAEREQEKKEKELNEKKKERQRQEEIERKKRAFENGYTEDNNKRIKKVETTIEDISKPKTEEEKLLEEENALIKKQLVGKQISKRILPTSQRTLSVLRYWDDDEDTTETNDSFYSNIRKVHLGLGKEYVPGADLRQQRKKNDYLKKLIEIRKLTGDDSEQIKQLQTKVKKEVPQTDILDKITGTSVTALKGDSWRDKTLEDMQTRDWNKFRLEKEIRIQGSRDILPIRFWEDGQFDEKIKHAIKDLGFNEVRAIQSQTIPIGLQQRDLIGIAQTGSGKTLAFVVPLLQYILSAPIEMRIQSKEQGPLAIIMAPTRELAQQINRDIEKLAKYCIVDGIDRYRDPYIKTLCIIGGESIIDQSGFMSSGIDIVVATPGRVQECIEKHILVLNQCNYIVLDEADRMIDIGFEKELNTVLNSMGSLLKGENEEEIESQLTDTNTNKYRYRTTVMFSATMSRPIEKIAKTFLRCPITVTIGNESQSINIDINQVVRFVKEEKKLSKLETILKESTGPIIVFCNMKRNVDTVCKQIRQLGIKAIGMHSGKSQDEREDILDDFSKGRFPILVATDVAARGLDIKGVKLVVNYDMPKEVETYIHRIGRTGRAGSKGSAITFITEADEDVYVPLAEYLLKNKVPIPREIRMNDKVNNQLGEKLNPGQRSTIFQ